MMIRLLSLIVFCISFLSGAPAQDSLLNVENIWHEGTFRAQSIPGFNFQKDGRHYTLLQGNEILQYDLTTGDSTGTILRAEELKGKSGFPGELDGYSFSKNEEKILLRTETEPIYRRSVRAYYFVYDRASGTVTSLDSAQKQLFATFSPNASKVAYVKNNDLYYYDLENEHEKRITSDGKKNHIINGGSDWVYEEEFSITRTFFWSPDGETLAFMRFDESKVPEFTMDWYRDNLYPERETFKYPKVGETNSTVRVFTYHLDSGERVEIPVGSEKDQYIPRMYWTENTDQLCIYRMNRHQNRLDLILADARSGEVSKLMTETNPYYINIHDNIRFLDDGEHFLWTSEKDGYNHLYLYNMEGEEIDVLTPGEWDMTAFYGFDKEDNTVYFQAARENPMEREVYRAYLGGGNLKRLSVQKGWNAARFSETYDYCVLIHSNIQSPPTYTVWETGGDKIRTIQDNQKLRDKAARMKLSKPNFIKYPSAGEYELNGFMITPPDFNPAKEYPVLMHVYGGPNSQTVTDRWKGAYYWWFQMLVQKGYIVVSVDNRGTGARGQEFRKCTYMQLGNLETKDQIAAAEYLASLPYVDGERIGIFGWSYGGYMSSLCILKGHEVFNAAIAVAPVTHWKWYDTIYTERYMRTVEENEDGYKKNSPVYFAGKLEDPYLLVHGMADDNVHFQHTAEMAAALIEENKQFDTYFYPNRNHGIYGGKTRWHLFDKITNFIERNL